MFLLKITEKYFVKKKFYKLENKYKKNNIYKNKINQKIKK